MGGIMDSGLTCVVGLIVGVICGVISASIMKSKGRSAGAGFAWGFLLGFIGLIIVALLPRNEEGIQQNLLTDGLHKQCPYCRKVIDVQATICPYCRSQLESISSWKIIPPKL
jgi:hypothetical protein